MDTGGGAAKTPEPHFNSVNTCPQREAIMKKRVISSLAIIGLAFMIQSCAFYAQPYGQVGFYGGDGPYYGFGLGLGSYSYYRYRPYGYYGYRPYGYRPYYYGHKPYRYYQYGPRNYGWGSPNRGSGRSRGFSGGGFGGLRRR